MSAVRTLDRLCARSYAVPEGIGSFSRATQHSAYGCVLGYHVPARSGLFFAPSYRHRNPNLGSCTACEARLSLRLQVDGILGAALPSLRLRYADSTNQLGDGFGLQLGRWRAFGSASGCFLGFERFALLALRGCFLGGGFFCCQPFLD